MKPKTNEVHEWAEEVYAYDKWNAAQLDRLESFATLAYAAGAAAMKERCAKVCDEKVAAEYATGKVDHNEMGWTHACAIAIRALGDDDE